jgi:cytochrome c-type biogenesis protein CcmH
MKFFAGITLFIVTFFTTVSSLWNLVLPDVSAVPTPPGVTDDQVNSIASELYCPVCENVPLDVCPTQACAQWRDLIRQKLNEGWNKNQIKDYFATQYGDRVLPEPHRRGLNWLVYILPPVFFLAGVFVVFQTLRKLKNAPKASVADQSPDPAASPYLSRLEEELRRREKE